MKARSPAGRSGGVVNRWAREGRDVGRLGDEAPTNAPTPALRSGVGYWTAPPAFASSSTNPSTNTNLPSGTTSTPVGKLRRKRRFSHIPPER
jgi:hypothetical protein